MSTTLVQLLSGRKKESSVWDYFSYDSTANKSRCTVPNDIGEPCGFLMAGKKTSNLKLHIKAKHMSLFNLIDTSDKAKQAPSSTVSKSSLGMHFSIVYKLANDKRNMLILSYLTL